MLLFSSELGMAWVFLVKYQAKDKENAIISTSKWCPMENCTLLVLGSQYGIQIYDWDGSNMVYEFDFLEHGVMGDEKQVDMVRIYQ